MEIDQSYEEVLKRKAETSVMTIEKVEVPWYYDIVKFLELGAYPNGANKRKCCSISMMATQYVLYERQLYRRSYNGIHLRCLKKEEAEKGMGEGNGRSSSRDLWPSNEWENVSQENPKDRVLLEYNGDQLCGLC